mmetsp:Transcript_37689/g.87003  ORF Transcript_37689/g.87003 Transcript_37689/m.87003 type:complete len:208 (-) Transcript_37689:72-695(-)
MSTLASGSLTARRSSFGRSKSTNSWKPIYPFLPASKSENSTLMFLTHLSAPGSRASRAARNSFTLSFLSLFTSIVLKTFLRCTVYLKCRRKYRNSCRLMPSFSSSVEENMTLASSNAATSISLTQPFPSTCSVNRLPYSAFKPAMRSGSSRISFSRSLNVTNLSKMAFRFCLFSSPASTGSTESKFSSNSFAADFVLSPDVGAILCT